MSDNILPQQKRPKLIPAFGPADQQTEEQAIRGVIAWSREAQPDIGEYGPPKTLFVSGDVPDMA